MNNLPIKLLSAHAKAPIYATDGAAGMDFYVPDDFVTDRAYPGHSVVVKLGIAVQIPSGWALMLMGRSGHGFNSNVRLANCIGLIDSDYRGELAAKITCDHGDGLIIKAGDRICQGVLVPAPQFSIMVVNELDDTERGEGGFGSTDVDFMQRYINLSSEIAMTIAMDEDGGVFEYSKTYGDVYQDGARWYYPHSETCDVALLGDDEENKHLWRESKRVRTEKGWVKG